MYTFHKRPSLKIKLKPSGKKYFTEKGYEPAYGARPMRRLIQKEIEDKIANLILDKTAEKGDTILVESKNEKVIVSVQKEKKEEQNKEIQPKNKNKTKNSKKQVTIV